MSILSTLVADPGRANTAAPPTANGSAGLLSTVGTLLGGLVGVPGVGNALGTIGDSVLASTTSTTASANPGRAIATGMLEGSGNVISRTGQALSLVTGGGLSFNTSRAMGLTGLPRGTARMARILTRWDGVTSAANALGLSVEQTAWLATRPVRRRGITAASLRTTRRTLRQVHSITRSFKKLKAC